MLFIYIYTHTHTHTHIKEQYNEFKVATTQFHQPAIHSHFSLHAPSPNLDYFEEIYWRVLHKGMTFNSSPDCQVENILWRRSTDGNRKTCYVVAQSCRTLCEPMNCSTSGFPVLYYLLEFAQTHAKWVSDASSLVSPFSSCPQSFPESGSFPMSRLFISGGQSIGISVSASVLLMNIQGWFPFRLTCLISSLSKGTLKSLLQHHSSKASILWCSAFFMVQLSHLYMTVGKTTALTTQPSVCYEPVTIIQVHLQQLSWKW